MNAADTGESAVEVIDGLLCKLAGQVDSSAVNRGGRELVERANQWADPVGEGERAATGADDQLRRPLGRAGGAQVPPSFPVEEASTSDSATEPCAASATSSSNKR